MKYITAYKLFTLKNDKIYPLFINKNESVPLNEWLTAEIHKTSGFALRPGWHAGTLPYAPHLRTKKNKIMKNRVWAEVRLSANVNFTNKANSTKTKDLRDELPHDGFYYFNTNKNQGKTWIIAGSMYVVKVLTNCEVYQLLVTNGITHEDALAETSTDNEV